MATENLETKFLASTIYNDEVDFKKLRFIFREIEQYADRMSVEVSRLKVLEVACGAGGITLPLATLGCSVTAFDVDEVRVEMLKAECGRRGIGNIRASVDDGYTFSDATKYNVVIASEVFEHVTEPERLAENLKRNLTDDGLLIVTTPNGYGPWELSNKLDLVALLRKNTLLRRIFNKPPCKQDSGHHHVQFYTRSRLIHMFSSRSFRLNSFGNSDSIFAAIPFLRTFRQISIIDTQLADILPSWIASGWFLSFQLEK